VGPIVLLSVLAERPSRLPALPRRLGPRVSAHTLSALVVLVIAGVAFAFGVSAGRSVASAPTRVEVVLTTADLSQRLARLPDVTFGDPPPPGAAVINIDDRVRYQRVTGFGGAMTDTSAWLLYDELSPATRAAVMNELFGAHGIHLNFLRLPIGASDFTKDGAPYSYDDMSPLASDPLLAHFSIDHDRAYIVPALRQVLALDPGVEILADPWTPPAWMKSNDSLDNQGNQGLLLNSAYGPWATYFVKFLQDYAQLGIRISAITPQNEPTNPTLYPGLDLDSSSEASFITRFLVPALRQAGLHPKIYGGDVGVDALAAPYASAIDGQSVELQSGRDYVNTIANGPAAGELSGIAWHCYYGDPEVMSTLHTTAPKLDQIVDECSPGITPFSISELVIFGLRNWASAVALWNLALDPRGGPVEPPNRGCPTCTGIVTVDQNSHTVRFNQAFFQLAQASAYVQPGAQRIRSDHFVAYGYSRRGEDVATPGLDDVALLNPDGSHVLIAYNNAARPVTFAVRWHSRSFTYTLAAGATATFLWD
jgi:glucosylceramidase